MKISKLFFYSKLDGWESDSRFWNMQDVERSGGMIIQDSEANLEA